MKTEKNQGFTLIEVMIVVGILGVIAAIAIPAYKGYISTSHKTECQNEVASIKLAESEHFLEQNSYFSGTGYVELEKNSSNIYQASKVLKTAKSQCTYKVTITTSPPTYTIEADVNTNGGNLAGQTNPIVKISGP
jgi:prepilin-type N-terminal cleavage/methylation domain-containing protein